MNGSLRGADPTPAAIALEAAAALRQLGSLGHERPVLLAYWPIARLNPYQALLYRDGWRHGVAAVGLPSLDDVESLLPIAAAAGARLVLHIHWQADVLAEAADEAEAEVLAAAFEDRLDRLGEAGVQLVWTVHNALPHDARLPAVEARLQQAICDRAAVVHVLSATTPAAVGEWCAIPEERTLVVAHPNYVGAYVDLVSREQARWELGLDPDATVYAMLGALRPYKGGTALLDAFDEVLRRDGGPRHLVIAGMPSDDPGTRELLERCALHPFVSLHARRIPADEMQRFLRAADVVVLPYLRSLNSGVLLLALSFGVPVIAPAGPTAEIVEPSFGRTFEPGDPESLAGALLAADELATPAARAAALRTAQRYDSTRLSAAFAAGLVDRLRSAEPPAPALPPERRRAAAGHGVAQPA